MKKLSDPRTTLEIVNRYGFDFRKRFGQNFLVDESIILRSLETAGVSREDVVFEIGPGIGTLTQYLSEAAGHVVSVEIDKKLIPILGETLQGYENVEVINEDVLDVDLCALAEKYHAGRNASGSAHGNAPSVPDSGTCSTVEAGHASCKNSSDPSALRPLKIVANLPYYITTPILMSLFRQKVPAVSITVMVQKEVADRMCAEPGNKDYGALSVAVQYYSAPRIVELVPPSSFIPHPKVTSAVVMMDLYEQPPVRARDEALFNAVVRAAFEQRRKTLINALSSAAAVSYGKEDIKNALNQLGLSASIRGEKLTVADFVHLSDTLSSSSLS